MDNNASTSSPAARMDRRLARPWWRRRPILMAFAIIALLAAGGAAFLILPPPGTMTTALASMDSGEVIEGPFQDYVPLRANVAPLDITYITAVAGGQVASVSAQDGDLVAAGQELARLDNPDLSRQVASQEADVSGRISDTNNQLMTLRTNEAERDQALADAQYALHKAQENLQRYQRLREQGVANDANVKPYADEADYQRARVAALEKAQGSDASFFAGQRQQIDASAQDLRRSLAAVRRGLDALTLRAPIAGRLTGFDLKPGQAVKAGDALGEVDSEGQWKLSAEVDEFYLTRLSPGLTAMANVHGQNVSVRISKIYPQVHDGHITVELQFDGGPQAKGGPADLKRGEAIDVRLSLGKTSQALLAPSGSWLNDSNGTYAFVLDASGKSADRRAITTGRRNPDYIEVLSGLKPGERIVTSSLTAYSKAQHLRFNQSESQ
ncbi:MAG TPA: HlyD family efflux transporter periplasmic adaptor subunit [Asticcacaulis sp.]|nr:HlyD family efflux transporter periplasmic adaptor subunit [Asticcacaulis sp.]